MAVPSGTPGAGDSGLPTVEAEAIDGATGDPYEIAQAAFLAQPPADETPEDDASDSEQVAEASVDEADSTAESDEDADLASYPEAVREQFRSLPPETRKALFEHAEANAREGLRAVQEREAAIAKAEADRQAAIVAAEAAKQAAVKAVQAKVGKFIGDEPIVRMGRDGIERTFPTLEESLQLNQNPRGRQQAYEKYNLDEDELSAHIDDLVGKRTILDESIGWQKDQALYEIDAEMRAGFREVGVEDVIVNGARSPAEIVPVVVRHLRAEFEAEKAEMQRAHDARVEALNVNAEGLRGRALAGSSRQLATGGRSAGHTNGKVTTQSLIDEAGSVEAYTERAMRGDYAGLKLSE